MRAARDRDVMVSLGGTRAKQGGTPPVPGPTLAILQQVVPHYRVGVFERLGVKFHGAVTLYAESFAAPLTELKAVRVGSIGLGRTRFHGRPLWNLIVRRHTAIICEGRLGLITSTLLALLGTWWRVRVIWWSPLWRSNGKIEVGGGLRGWFQGLVMRRSACVLAYSSAACDAARRAGVPQDRVYIAPNSLDTHALEAAERKWRGRAADLDAFRRRAGLDGCRVALFVGHIIERKRLDVLIQAFSLLLSDGKNADFRLAVVGGGPGLGKCESQVRSLGIDQYVHFAGEVTAFDETCPYFLSSRVVVLPGAGGLAINQALTHGVPVIVGLGGGDGTERDAITDQKNGIFWDGVSTSQLARQVETFLLATDEEWAVWSREARNSIRQLVNIELMLEGIQGAIEGGGRSGR